MPDHPTLAHPITRSQFMNEFYVVWGLSQLRQHKHHSVSFSEVLGKTHCRNNRRYAEVEVQTCHFYFAPQTLWLPRANRLGLLGHEVGHVLAGVNGSENDADQAALEVLGIAITYDKRWPGRGLQTGRFVR